MSGTLLQIDSTSFDVKTSFGEDLEQSTTSIGLIGSGFGVGLGYGVGPNAFLGAHLSMASTEVSVNAPEVGNRKVTALSFAPYLEYVFSEDAEFRPLLTGRFGIMSGTEESGDVEVSQSRYFMGVGLGAHAFLTPSFSIDPLVSFNFHTGSIGDRSAPIEDVDTSGTTILVTLGFSGWLGGRAAPSTVEIPVPPADETATETDAEAAPVEPPPRAREPVGSKPVQVIETLPGGHVLTLKARPEVAAESVMVRLIEDARTSRLLQCENVAVVSLMERDELRRFRPIERRLVAGERRVVGEWLASAKPVAAMLKDPESYIDVCGERWALTPVTRRGIRQFLKEFQERGGVGGEPPAAGPVQTVDPSAPSEPGSTPPSSAPQVPPLEGSVPPASTAGPAAPPQAAPPSSAPAPAAPPPGSAKPPAPAPAPK